MQIAENIHALRIPFQVASKSGSRIDRFVYVYLIYGKNICLIDSGIANSEQTIFNYLKITGRKPEEISLLILTHSHPDHIGAARAIKRLTGCCIAAHAAEIPWIEDVNKQSIERPIPGFHSLVGGSVKVDCIIGDGDAFDLDALDIRVLHTPGHSRGSISLLIPSEGALFCGDAIPIAGDVPIYEDALASVRSIKKLMAIDGLDYLLAAWDDPKKEGIVYDLMDDGLKYLQRIHQAVIKVDKAYPLLGSMDLCRRVLRELDMPEEIANPLVEESLKSNLKVRDRQDLLDSILSKN